MPYTPSYSFLMSITKIVSGGQTGADRGGLDAAIHCKLDYGGWIPKGRKAEKGIKVPLEYEHLREHQSGDYLARTEANVVDSDATAVFTHGKPTGGSKKTIDLADKHDRPCLAVDLDRSRSEGVDEIAEWLEADCPSNCILNVAGSRESKDPSIGRTVMAWMIDVISKANGTLFYPIDDHRPAMILRDQKC